MTDKAAAVVGPAALVGRVLPLRRPLRGHTASLDRVVAGGAAPVGRAALVSRVLPVGQPALVGPAVQPVRLRPVRRLQRWTS